MRFALHVGNVRLPFLPAPDIGQTFDSDAHRQKNAQLVGTVSPGL